uniref:Uncharacterized protein n=1 Tax=Romanomermis culicivorax TaxID=13658 RepID=A0A915JWD9_ROMCU
MFISNEIGRLNMPSEISLTICKLKSFVKLPFVKKPTTSPIEPTICTELGTKTCFNIKIR